MPSAPSREEVYGSAKPRRKQIKVQPQERIQYLPSEGKSPLQFNVSPDLFMVNEHCDPKVQIVNNTFLSFVCKKQQEEHDCSQKSIQVMFRDSLQTPDTSTISFHLKMIHDDPSHIFTIRRLLDELSENYLKKYKIERVCIAADGKIYDLLCKLMEDYAQVYSFVLPMLGEFHLNAAYVRTIYKRHGGFFLQSMARKCGYSGATLTRIMKCQDYRVSVGFLYLAYEAVLTVLTHSFEEYCQQACPELPTLGQCADLEEVLQKIEPYAERFQEFCGLLCDKSEIFKMLVQFCFEDFAPFLQMTQAIQTGDHQLRSESIVRMLPSFFSMDSIHYKRWATLDVAIRNSLFPKDLLKTFQETGCWRTNICQRKGSHVPSDQYHETKCNLDMKSNLNRNRMSSEIFANIGFWLPQRAKFIKEFKAFVFPYKQWNTRNDPERHAGKPEMNRYQEKLVKCIEFLNENTELSIDNLQDDTFKQTLHAICGGEMLVGKGAAARLLSSRKLGNDELQRFVHERIISGTKAVGDHIPKMNIEVFSFIDHKKKKSQKRKAPKEKLELKQTNQILRILPMRPICDSADLGNFQLSDYTALTSDSADGGPNIRSNKSNAFSDFIVKVCPESVSTCQPRINRDTSVTILETENIIACGPGEGSKKTVSEHIDALFKHKILPYFSNSQHVVILFDDEQGKELKMTDMSRYSNNYEKLNVTMNMVIPDWNLIFKNKENKLSFKIQMIKRIENDLKHLIDENCFLYINGPRNLNLGQVTWISKMSGPSVVPGWVLTLGESDTKIFQLIEKFNQDYKTTTFLIYSADTDVKFLSIYYSALWINKLEIIVKSGKNMVPSFFEPLKVCQFLHDAYPQTVLESAEGLLKTFLVLGSDANPGFVNIAHATGLWVFHQRAEAGATLTSKEDLTHLILDVYEKKNPGLKRFFPDQHQVSLSERIRKLRVTIKSYHGSESLTVPLESVLKLHCMRTEYLFLVMTEPGYKDIFSPEEHGWCKEANDDTKFAVQIQDTNDPLYRIPKNIVKGCSCKGVCTNRCSCKKDSDRMNICTSVTCKNCHCNKPDNASGQELMEESSDSDSGQSEISIDSDLEFSSDSEISSGSADNIVEQFVFDEEDN